MIRTNTAPYGTSQYFEIQTSNLVAFNIQQNMSGRERIRIHQNAARMGFNLGSTSDTSDGCCLRSCQCCADVCDACFSKTFTLVLGRQCNEPAQGSFDCQCLAASGGGVLSSIAALVLGIMGAQVCDPVMMGIAFPTSAILCGASICCLRESNI